MALAILLHLCVCRESFQAPQPSKPVFESRSTTGTVRFSLELKRLQSRNMMRRRRAGLSIFSKIFGACAIMLCAANVTGCGPVTTTTTPSATIITPQWPMYNGTYSADRYSALDSITPTNAHSLRVVCRRSLGETGAFQAGPVVVQDTVYVTTKDNTYAIDATNCNVKWKSVYTPSAREVFNTNRGVAYDSGTLYRGTQDAHVIALDAATGKITWNVQAADPSRGFFLSAAPIVWHNLVFIGVAGADWGTRGQ